MELIKDTIISPEETAAGATQLMVDGDIIVPDKKSDILKTVQVDADAVIIGKEPADGKIFIDGRLDLKIMYIPDNESESLQSIITSFDFTHRVDKQGITPDSDVFLDASAERVEYQLINSRKLRIKAICRIDYSAVTAAETELVTAVEGDAEVMRDSISACVMSAAAEREFTVKGIAEPPSGKPSIAEILKTDVKLCEREYKPLTDKIVIKGAAHVAVLYTATDGRIDFAEAQLPFTEVFELENVRDESVCDISYTVTETLCELKSDSDGDMRIVDIQLSVSAKIRAEIIAETEFIKDLYVPAMITAPEYERRRIEEIRLLAPVRTTMRELIPLAKNAPPISAVYNVITDARTTNTEFSSGRLNIEGTIDAYILYICAGGDNPVYSMKKEIPFNVSTECDTSGGAAEVSATIEHTSYNLTAANEVELRCILAVEARITDTCEIDVLTDCEVTEIPADEKKGIVVYFAQTGDTVWDIAKRYRVSADRLMEFNATDPDQLHTGTRLIIPM